MRSWWRNLQRRHPFRAVQAQNQKLLKKWLSHLYVPLSAFLYPFFGINRAYQRFLQTEHPEGLFHQALASLQISSRIASGSLESIPKEGPLVVIANHPTGGVDGLILASLLEKRGRAFRIMVMADTGLEKVPEIEAFIFPIDLKENSQRPERNLRVLRSALDWLRSGEALIVFPAGGLPRRNPETQKVEEPEWRDNVIKFLMKSKAAILPVYLKMQSSGFYQWMGEQNESFRVGLLGEQIIRLRNHEIPIVIGEKISLDALDPEEAQDLSRLKAQLRRSVFELQNHCEDA